MEDGSYTADDKWDVFVAGPAGTRLEVRYGALRHTTMRRSGLILSELKKKSKR